MGCCGSAEATACTNNDEVASPLAVSFSRGGADEDPTGLPRLLGRSASSAAASASCESLKSGQERPATGAAAPDLGQPLSSGDGPGVASSSAVCNSAGTAWQLAKVENEEAPEALARGWECLRADEPLRAVGYFTEAIKILPTSAEAYNLRGIAKELTQTPGAHQDDQDYQADYQRADQLAGDPETKKRLEMLRKWKPVGWQVRREVEAKTLASEADFLISFTTGDAEANNATLRMLQEGCEFVGEVRPMSFCTDKSLGLGHFGEEGPRTMAQRKEGELPPWFLHYKRAAEATKHGILIVNLTRSYFNSVACMWEFGYLQRPELVHVFVPGMPGHPPRIAKWEELARDASLCVRAFRIHGPDGQQQLMDSLEDPGLLDPRHAESVLTRIEELQQRENKELRKQEAWCQLPLAQLSHTLAVSYFGEMSTQAMGWQHRLASLCLQTGQALEARDLAERLCKSMEQAYGPESAEVAKTLNNLANACGALGDHREKKRLLAKALVINER
ncbi:NPHP3, partial [Symbiodinium sp. CCMP2456]